MPADLLKALGLASTNSGTYLGSGEWSTTTDAGLLQSINPTTNEVGVHSFLFTATGTDGFDEEFITITVTAEDPAPNAYEQWADEQGMDPDGANGALADDFDNDGIPNEQEFWADTSPTNGLSYPQIKALQLSGTTLNITMDKSSAAPRAYVIHTANQMTGNSWDWQVLGTNNSTTGVLPVNDPASPILLFRVTVPPTP